MNDIIRNAFKALEEMVDIDIVVEPVKEKRLTESIDIEDEEEPEAKTIRELFEADSSYVLLHEFEVNSVPHLLFIEALNDGISCDLLFEEFSISNIDGVIIEILDQERNFIGEFAETNPELLNLDTEVEDMISHAQSVVSQSPEEGRYEAPRATEEQQEGNVVRESESAPEQPQEQEQKEEEHQEEELLMESGSGERFFPGEDGDVEAAEFVEDNKIDDFRISWDKVRDGYVLSWGVVPEEQPIEESKSEGHQRFSKDSKLFIKRMKTSSQDKKEEDLNESKLFDVRDKEQLEQAKDVLETNEEGETIEKVVDVNAESVTDLKKSYIGDTILRCPVCKTMIYKSPEELVKQEEEGEGERLFNVDEECPHCGSKDGFELIGQVASLSVETPQEEEQEEQKEEDTQEETEPAKEEQEEQPEEQPEEQGEEKPSVELIPEEEEVKESLLDDTHMEVILETLNEESFNDLAQRYLCEVYNNIESYKTTGTSVNNETNRITVEGQIKFKSGKVKDTQFVFEAKEITKRGKVKLVGLNETFTKKKAFTLVGLIEEKNILSESLTYSYKIDDKKVYGHVKAPSKK